MVLWTSGDGCVGGGGVVSAIAVGSTQWRTIEINNGFGGTQGSQRTRCHAIDDVRAAVIDIAYGLGGSPPFAVVGDVDDRFGGGSLLV